MARRLTRRAKDLVCMRQLATCGYCGQPLCDAFEVDHINEHRLDDREANLAATCALCHAIKSRHVRLKRDWNYMRDALCRNLADARNRWTHAPQWDTLPSWLQERLDFSDARVYYLTLQVTTPTLDLEKYRYRKGPEVRHDTI